MGEFWTSAFVIVCVLVMVVVPVHALARGIREERQDRRRDTLARHVNDTPPGAKRDQGTV